MCTIHQNVKLMMEGGRLAALTNGWFTDYKDCLAAIQCESPEYDCAVGKCAECPGAELLREELEAVMEENGVETVHYNQWTNTDRANLETRIVPVGVSGCVHGCIEKIAIARFYSKESSQVSSI